MYTKDNAQKGRGGVYIPPDYRGNALYFEAPECGRGEGEDEQRADPPQKCEDVGKPHVSRPFSLSRLFEGEGMILLAVGAVLFLSVIDKKHDVCPCDGGVEESNLDLVLVAVIIYLLLS